VSILSRLALAVKDPIDGPEGADGGQHQQAEDQRPHHEDGGDRPEGVHAGSVSEGPPGVEPRGDLQPKRIPVRSATPTVIDRAGPVQLRLPGACRCCSSEGKVVTHTQPPRRVASEPPGYSPCVRALPLPLVASR